MKPFALSSEAERTMLLLALFFSLLIMLVLVFITFDRKSKHPGRTLNLCLFTACFVLLMILSAVHDYIASGMPLIFHTGIPVIVLWCAAAALFMYAAFGVSSEYSRRSQTIDRNSIKEALDTLPVAVCYFSGNGMVKLCNLQMYRLFYALAQSDLQSLDELHGALDGCDARTGIIRLPGEEPVYIFPDGQAWFFAENALQLSDGSRCTEAVFYDVTELYETRLEIEAQTKKLRELGRNIRELSENVVAATKEEEMLSFKTTLHDRMGAGLVAARQVLLQNRPLGELDAVIHEWKRSVSLVKHDNDAPADRGELSELIRDAKAIGVELIMDGELPSDCDTCDVFLSAIRECLTNCVRHADGTELYVNICGGTINDIITVTNNGKAPQYDIVPRGGLSNLIKRVGYIGGTAQIQSAPMFRLTVSIPKNRGVLR